jgi:hypothetical protein
VRGRPRRDKKEKVRVNTEGTEKEHTDHRQERPSSVT